MINRAIFQPVWHSGDKNFKHMEYCWNKENFDQQAI